MEQRAFGTCLLTVDGKSFTLFSDVRVRRLLTSLCRISWGLGTGRWRTVQTPKLYWLWS